MKVIFDEAVGGCVRLAVGALAGPAPVVFPASRHPRKGTSKSAGRKAHVEIDRVVVIFCRPHRTIREENRDAVVTYALGAVPF